MDRDFLFKNEFVVCWTNACEGNFSTSMNSKSRAFSVPVNQCNCKVKAMIGMTKSQLIDQRNELEQMALAWADRWIAANPEYDARFSISCVRPISFDRAEVEAVCAAALKETLRRQGQ